MSADLGEPSALRAGVVNVVNDRLTARIVAALRTDGIRAIVLKGASVREWLYDDAEHRQSDDVDLLVSPADRGAVAGRLRALGMRYLGPSKVGRDRRHERLWQHPETGMVVELHESLSGIGVDAGTAWRVLSSETERMSIGGEAVEVLGIARRTLHLALHAAHHGPTAARPIADLDRALATLPEQRWREAAGLAAQLDARAAFYAGLRLSDRGRTLAPRLAPSDEEVPPLDVALRAQGAPPVAEGLAWLFEARGARAKLVFLSQALFPPAGVMRAWSPLARRNRFGLTLMYLWRPLWLAGHAVPAYLAIRRVRRQSG